MTDLGIPGVGDATPIASGGSALVYRALSGTGEQLAVKVLRGIHGTEVARRFERELSAAERLSGHPNIMQILHTGLTGAGEPYLVMPLIAGGSLNDELERHGAFSLQAATRDVALAADALEFAHNRGVLHRDIKPANLLRADDGSIIVTDFGIARVVDAGITSATIGASTPLFAAPEVLTDNKASVHSEVYGLAALLYALLAGRAAFADADNVWATMHRVRTERPTDIAGVPEPVMRVIQQAMSKQPIDRPASAMQFRENLRVALSAPPEWTPPPPTVELPPDDIVLGPSMQPAPPGTPAFDPVATHTLLPEFAGASPALEPPAPPPVPAYGRAAPAVGHAPRRDSATAKILGATAALLLVAGLAWWATTRLLEGANTDTNGNTAITPPVDNSLPSPDTDTDTDTDTDSGDSTGDQTGGDQDDDNDVSIDDLPTSPEIATTFVSFTGDHYSALLPEGWALAARDTDEGYGFRSRFVNGNTYLNIDTTPKEQRESGVDVAQSARDIAASIDSASEVRTEVVDDLTMHSFTFRNNRGVASIDIFFEVDGDGYAVVAGSASDPDTAFATARLVALSIRSNPSY